MPIQPEPFGVLLTSGSHARAHAAFMFATGAAAIGRVVIMFATGQGCRALLTDWSSVSDAGRDAAIRARGVAGLGELREQALALDVKLIVCETGLRSENLPRAGLLPECEVAGIPTFLEGVGAGQILSF
jgi:uncharacterized protein